jgi:DNA-binding IclR family transcriptional regulator
VDLEEFIQGVRCVAVPIRGREGNVAGALSLSASVFQLREDDIGRYGALLQDAAYEISGRLGYIP